MIKTLASRTFFKSVLIFNSIIVLAPVLFLINSSLRKTNDFALTPMKLARNPYWQNYKDVWAGGNFPIYLKNSLIVTGG